MGIRSQWAKEILLNLELRKFSFILKAIIFHHVLGLLLLNRELSIAIM